MKSTTAKRTRRLSSKQVNFLKARLLEKRRQLLAKLETSREQELLADSHASGDDMLDQALNLEDREASFQIAEIESAQVEQIDDAIERMQEGTYGVCEMCAEAIPAARLKALPSATLCIECKSAEERLGGGYQMSPRGRFGFEEVRDSTFDPESVYGSVRGRKVS
jgi:DnaK suppressor protein